MNLVGKILVVAIFVMSLVWMAFAMAVYSTQKNWKEVAERPREQATATLKPGLKFQLEDAQKESADLKTKLAEMQKKIEEVKEAEKQQRAKLETSLAEQQTQREALDTRVKELEAASRDKIAAVTAAQDNLSRLTEQVAKLNTDIVAALEDRDSKFTEATNKTIALHDAHSEVKTLKERSFSLAKNIEFYKNKLASLGVKNPDEPVVDSKIEVDGLVTAIQKGDLIEISIGSDDGLKVGSVLHVYRAGRAYLGRVQVIETSPDRAAAKILRDARTGIIQKGDRVATSLKVS